MDLKSLAGITPQDHELLNHRQLRLFYQAEPAEQSRTQTLPLLRPQRTTCAEYAHMHANFLQVSHRALTEDCSTQRDSSWLSGDWNDSAPQLTNPDRDISGKQFVIAMISHVNQQINDKRALEPCKINSNM